MNGGKQYLETVEIVLRGTHSFHTIYINVFDNSLARKWLDQLNNVIRHNLHLEKNYCFLGFPFSQRNGTYILNQVNTSIQAINNADLGYHINDEFTLSNTCDAQGKLIHDKLNVLHRYFEDLQGHSGHMSEFFTRANSLTRWHIRQLNLLCHEFESWALSMRKHHTAPEWRRPSTLMCWLNAPRFALDEQDYELFGIETLARPLGGVFVGVNKAVGKSHWEVYQDEGRSVEELTTTALRNQTEAAADFDIEWGNNPGNYSFMRERMAGFRQWLIDNGFDPEDKSLTLGHPQIGQVDLPRSFGSLDYQVIWDILDQHLDVYKISTSSESATYEYHWQDPDYMEQQLQYIR